MGTDCTTEPRDHRTSLFVATATVSVAAIAFTIYALTAFRTLAWWDNADYITAATTLGIAHPPGSLLLTLTGWVISKFPLGFSKAFAFNLFAGVMASVTAALVCVVAARLIGVGRGSLRAAPMATWVIVPVAMAVTLFSFSEAFWSFATKFNPYVMTALFTALILAAMVRWWESPSHPGACEWLFVTALLFGLDLSVHRTNLLMLPGLAVWVLLRRPRAVLSLANWFCGVTGLAIGGAVQLLLIPMALRKPLLNWGDPSNFSRFWDYVSLEQYGGGWLVNIYPRQAPFWDYQIMDYLRAFRDNFFSFDGALGFLGFVPLLLGLIGIGHLWKHRPRLAVGMVCLFLMTSLGAVVYFNLPEDFPRSITRHYLGSFVIWGVWMAIGAGCAIGNLARISKRWRWAVTPVTTMAVALAVVGQGTRNFNNVNSSNSHFAYDYAQNLLLHLADDAILVTYSDVDTFPLWYLQLIDGVRPDVTVCCIPLLNTDWYVPSLVAHDKRLPLSMTDSEFQALNHEFWQPRTIPLPVHDSPGFDPFPTDVVLPDTIYVQIPPDSAGFVLIQDQLLLRLVAENQWRRPVYFSVGGGQSAPAPWAPYLRLEGIARQLVPTESPEMDVDLLRANVLKRYTYRGYNDPSVPINSRTGWAAHNYWTAFLRLAAAEHESGVEGACGNVVTHGLDKLPPDRVGLAPGLREQLQTVCSP